MLAKILIFLVCFKIVASSLQENDASESNDSNELGVILCIDGETRCKEDETCCTRFMAIFDISHCCPHTNGVCCSDGYHCCPSGQTCVDDTWECINEQENLPDVKKQKLNELGEYLCNDLKTYCPDSQTCCTQYSEHFDISHCCPHKNGVCCSDGYHCCPSGQTCVDGTWECITEQENLPDVKKQKAAPVDIHFCPDRELYCPDGTTCCRRFDGEFGCCPLPDAVCCTGDGCCPSGYTCISGKCDNGFESIPMFKKTEAVKLLHAENRYDISKTTNIEIDEEEKVRFDSL